MFAPTPATCVTNVLIAHSAISPSFQARAILEKHKILLHIAAHIEGNDNDKTIVLIHGNGAAKSTFTKINVVSSLAQKYRVIALDLPGHGESVMLNKIENLSDTERTILAEAIYNMPAMIAQVAQALKALQVKKACIFGWSLGGHIGHGLAIQHDDLVGSLVTCGTPPINFNKKEKFHKGFTDWFVNSIIKEWEDHPKNFKRQDWVEGGKTFLGAESIVASMGYTEVGENQKDDYMVTAMMAADPLLRKFLFSSLAQHANNKALKGRKFLKEYVNHKIPIGFFEGEQDKGCVFERLATFYNTYIKEDSDSELRSFATGGHAVHYQHPEAFVEFISRYAERAAVTRSPKP